jgi:type II secretory pathway component PulK
MSNIHRTTRRSCGPRIRTRSRGGYALLMCLLVAAVSSLAVMGILNTARFETMESAAKQRSTAAYWAARAGIEFGVASLLDNPTLRGQLLPIQLPPGSSNVVTIDIQQAGQNITIASSATVAGLSKTQNVSFTTSQLRQRIAATAR